MKWNALFLCLLFCLPTILAQQTNLFEQQISPTLTTTADDAVDISATMPFWMQSNWLKSGQSKKKNTAASRMTVAFTNCPGDISTNNDAGECSAVVTYPGLEVNDPGCDPGTVEQNLATPYNTNNGQRGNMFDVEATNTITVTSFDCNLYSGTTGYYEIYYKEGTHVGFENNASAWTFIGGASNITSNGNNVPTPLPIDINIVIPAGETYAFYITNDFGAGTSYTDGTAVGNFLAGNADLTVYEGVGKSYPFGLTFTTRRFNGTIYYLDGGCGVTVEQTAGLGSGNAFPVGTTTETYVATDLDGNTATCSFDVTVNDTEAPQAVCQDITLELDMNNMYSLSASEIDGGSTDNCSIDNLSASPNTFDVNDVGNNNVTLTVTDPSSNMANCTAVVTVDPNPNANTYYADNDMDGFGDPNNSILSGDPSPPAGYVTDNTDCDDNDANEFPGQTWYLDADGDGYSDGTSITDCERPVDYYLATELTATSGDCNDNDSAINPDASEVCDGIDNNCDTQIDEGVQTTYYADNDMDGFGDPNNSSTACTIPDGFVTDNTDCDDNDADEFPGQTWLLDEDGDGYSDGTSTTDCERPVDYYLASELTATSGDCNDSDSAINPDATEICDGIDNNCDTQIDEGVQNTYYADNDMDGFGDPNNTIMACVLPDGYVSNDADCDDNDADEFPGQTWYLDGDGDGYSDGTSTMACERPVDYFLAAELIATSGDCNDSDAAINPDATEVCDGIDNNCDTQIDEGVENTYYADNDMDGFGDPNNTTMACAQPTGFVTDNTDCDDNDADEFPGQIWYKDADGDLYSDGTTITTCERPADHYLPGELTATSGDCDDNTSSVNPEATEVCDGIDNNCDNQIDEGVQNTYYADTDMDGFGDPNNSTMACERPEGYVTDDTDCDDSNADINPAAVEVCNGVDDNCNGLIDGEDPNLKSIWSYDDVTDIAGAEGSATFDPCAIDNENVTLTYYSPNQNTSVDNHGYLHTELCGDGEISFKVESVSNYAYVGLTMRESADPGAKQASLFSNQTNVLRWETRYTDNGALQVNAFYKPFPFWIKLVRQGSWVFGYYSNNGASWNIVHAVQLPMNECIEAGISIWSFFPGTTETVTVSNVSFIEYSSPANEPELPIAEVNPVSKEWNLYPNPATEEIFLEWNNEPAPEQIQVYDRAGRLVNMVAINAEHSGLIRLEVNQLTPGMYWLRAIGKDGEHEVLPFVKE